MTNRLILKPLHLNCNCIKLCIHVHFQHFYGCSVIYDFMIAGPSEKLEEYVQDKGATGADTGYARVEDRYNTLEVYT